MSIWALLKKKHAKDILVNECLMGPAGSRRLDAWVLRRTWAPVSTVGYEIKTSRSDFMRDTKWPAYREACHELLFVCPHGLIQPSELPDDIGLLWVSKTGRTLVIKKKALRREIELPGELLVHVLMCRTVIVATTWEANAKEGDARQRRVAFWQTWLKERESRRGLGYEVRGKIKELYAKVNAENHRLQDLFSRYDDVRRHLEAMGIDPKSPPDRYQMQRRLADALSVVPAGFEAEARSLAAQAKSVADQLAGLREKAKGMMTVDKD